MTSSKVQKNLGHRLIGSGYMKRMVAKAIQKLPLEIQITVTSKCWFIGSFTDGWAFTLRGDEIKKGEYLIYLSDELLGATEEETIWTIIHEIGHVILGHRNSIGEVQTKSEIRRQEKEADEFTRGFIY